MNEGWSSGEGVFINRSGKGIAKVKKSLVKNFFVRISGSGMSKYKNLSKNIG